MVSVKRVAITTIEGGDTKINALEAENGISVSGTVDVGLTLQVNGVDIPVDGLGHWTTTLPRPAIDGNLLVTAVARDAMGRSYTATKTLFIDTVPPLVDITSI